MAQILIEIGAVGMALGIGAATQAEGIAIADEASQLLAVGEAALRLHEFGLASRWIAAQGQDILNPVFLELVENFGDLVRALAYTGKVAHGLHSGGALDV